MNINRNAIRMLIEQKNCKHRDVAKAIGILPKSFSLMLKNGKTKPEFVQKMADFFQVNINVIIGDSTDIHIKEKSIIESGEILQLRMEITYLRKLLESKEETINVLRMQIKDDQKGRRVG
jgi:hemerythrin-like domain-containing protein